MRRSWDAVYKELLARLFARWQILLTTQVEVGRLPRTIDAVAICTPEDRARLAQLTPFDFFQLHNLLEFKSPRDRLTPGKYKLVISRAYLYMHQTGVDDLSTVTVCIITSRKPRKVLGQVPELVKFQRVRQGLYRSDDKLPLYVLVASELPVEPRNYPLLLFASGRKMKEFLRALLQQPPGELLTFAFELYPEEVLAMSQQSSHKDHAAQVLVQHLGVPKVLELIGKDELMREDAVRILVQRLGVSRMLELMPKEEVVQELGKALIQDETFLRSLARQLDAATVERLRRSET